MPKYKKDVLIAYIPNRKDLAIAKEKKWYRIPTDIKRVPICVKNQTLRVIAFYQPKIFKEEAFKVNYYAIVNRIEIVSRKQLFRNEPENPKSIRKYFKIKLDKLLRLPHPIYSRRKRRILFINTTLDRFNNAEEINDLFLESPIEEMLWEEFKKNKIIAERQYLETINKKNFFIDFAIFCQKRNLAIECDGDKYHTKEIQVKKDKKRDNILASRGWNILRYTTEDIKYKIDETIYQVKDTINQYGGIKEIENVDRFKYFPQITRDETLFE